ncbi:MAG: PepSY-associated TM helix domain-containing protein [Akkermansiaceae bacterium]
MNKVENSSPKEKKRKKKGALTKQFYLWHWVSSAICLASMLLFAITGITLNHAESISVEPDVRKETITLPDALLRELGSLSKEEREAALPKSIAEYGAKELGVPLKGKVAEWSEFEIYLQLRRPGGDAWLLIDRETGELTFEKTNRGFVSYINDLHQGRNTGTAWSWYMDVFSVACVVFTITGLILLWVHSRRRPNTWPIVLAGILLPIIILLLFVH